MKSLQSSISKARDFLTSPRANSFILSGAKNQLNKYIEKLAKILTGVDQNDTAANAFLKTVSENLEVILSAIPAEEKNIAISACIHGILSCICKDLGC